MKILFLCHKMPYPLADGGCIATFNMMQGMVQNKAEVHALCMATPKHNGAIEQLPDNIRTMISWHRVFVDTTLKPVAALKNLFFSSLPYNAERFVSNAFGEELKALLSEHNYDVVQLEGLYLSPYVSLVRANSQAKIVMRSHNIEHKIWERMVVEEASMIKRKYKSLLSRRIRNMELNSLSEMDALVPISTIDAKFFSSHYKGPIKTSSTGIDAQKFERCNSDNPNFFHIGALDWEPNQAGLHWFLTKVWEPFKVKNQSLDFVLAGRHAPDNFIQDIKAHPIIFKGEVPIASAFVLEQGIMIVPLFSGSGMRIKIIEAMALGKCIITTPVGAEGIPVKDKEHLYICKDAAQMINTMQDLVQHPEKVKQIGANAYNFAKKHYNNEAITKDLLQFYKQIFSR